MPRPAIGPSPRFANVYFAFGHGHVGLCGGAPTARIIADLVAGRTPNIDIAPYRADRFEDYLRPGNGQLLPVPVTSQIDD